MAATAGPRRVCDDETPMPVNDAISRRLWLRTAAASAGAAACAPVPVAPAKPPNIVLCMGDDHGWHETGYNGHPHVQTPALDEMAESGLRLDRFYAAAPVCSPTRGSVMTGRHPNRYGTFGANWSIRPEEVGLARILGRAGYACGHFGKWHLGPVKADSPTNPGALGFEEWLSHDNFFELDPVLSRNGGPPEKHPGESSRVVTDAAIRFIDKARDEGRPFFAVIWFGSPHEPYSGVDEDLERYRNLPPGLRDQAVRLTSMDTGLRAEIRLDKALQARFAEITAMDRAIGSLRGHLRQRDLNRNTLLWYCSDNGAPGESRLASPLRGQKGRVYEGGVRVPGIVEWPERIPTARRSGVHAVTSDILPTLCEAAAQPVPNRPLDGLSLLPLFDGSMQARPEPICFWSFRPERLMDDSPEPYLPLELQQGTTPLVKLMDGRLTRNFRNFRYPRLDERDLGGARAILDSRYKLVLEGERSASNEAERGAVREMFDMRADPGETRNLAATSPDIVQGLERRLQDWQRSVLNSLTGADYA